jgi:two-component system KDP operon response regulator KdpE
MVATSAGVGTGGGAPEGPLRVLVTTDQELLARVIRLTLTHGAYVVRTAAEIAAAVALLDTWRPHLVVVEIDLLDGNVRATPLLEQIGHQTSGATRLPVIALTRRSDGETRLAAFDLGVDDILTVPFSPDEFLARALAVLRRAYHEAATFAPAITVGNLQLDLLRQRVQVGSVELHLTPLEQSLLYLLAANVGRVLTREEILGHLWGTGYIADSNVVDRHIRNLRVKLHDYWCRPRFLATVPRQGYRFLPATEMGPAEPPHAA